MLDFILQITIKIHVNGCVYQVQFFEPRRHEDTKFHEDIIDAIITHFANFATLRFKNTPPPTKKPSPIAQRWLRFFWGKDDYINIPPTEAIRPAKIKAMVLITLISGLIDGPAVSL